MTASALVTPEELMAYAIDGRLSKHALAGLLTHAARKPFYDACAAIEMKYTEACRALDDPCLASGCSAEGERCLQPVLNAGIDYYKACGAAWATLFAAVANREPSWRVMVTSYALL